MTVLYETDTHYIVKAKCGYEVYKNGSKAKCGYEVYKNGSKTKCGYEVYKNGSVVAIRSAVIGYKGDKGFNIAKEVCDRQTMKSKTVEFD